MSMQGIDENEKDESPAHSENLAGSSKNEKFCRICFAGEYNQISGQ